MSGSDLSFPVPPGVAKVFSWEGTCVLARSGTSVALGTTVLPAWYQICPIRLTTAKPLGSVAGLSAAGAAASLQPIRNSKTARHSWQQHVLYLLL